MIFCGARIGSPSFGKVKEYVPFVFLLSSMASLILILELVAGFCHSASRNFKRFSSKISVTVRPFSFAPLLSVPTSIVQRIFPSFWRFSAVFFTPEMSSGIAGNCITWVFPGILISTEVSPSAFILSGFKRNFKGIFFKISRIFSSTIPSVNCN